jgi:hypothetical protein
MRELLLLQLEKTDKSRFGQEEEHSDRNLSIAADLFMESAGVPRTIAFSIALKSLSLFCQLSQEISKLNGKLMMELFLVVIGIPQIILSFLAEKTASTECGINMVDSCITPLHMTTLSLA